MSLTTAGERQLVDALAMQREGYRALLAILEAERAAITAGDLDALERLGSEADVRCGVLAVTGAQLAEPLRAWRRAGSDGPGASEIDVALEGCLEALAAVQNAGAEIARLIEARRDGLVEELRALDDEAALAGTPASAARSGVLIDVSG